MQFPKLINIINFVKLEHSVFALPFLYSGIFLASNSFPPIKLLLLVTIAGFAARATAFALNRIIDKDIDKLNERTKNRELPAQKISLNQAFLLCWVFLITFLISSYFINSLFLSLTPIPLIMFLIYPYLKRFTYFCHFFLGLCIATAPFAGWIAVTGSLDNLLLPVVLSLAVALWVSGFDIIYALQDIEFDKKYNLYSIPAKFGKSFSLKLSSLLHIITFILFSSIFFLTNLNYFYLFAMLVVLLLIFWGQNLAKSNPEKAFFCANSLIGFTMLVGVFLGKFFPL